MTTYNDSPPNEVFLDLIDSKKSEYEVLRNIRLFTPTVRMIDDVLPSVHSVVDYIEIEQRTIPRNTRTKETVHIVIQYFTSDYRELWQFYQTIKEIFVKNNQLSTTPQYENFDVEWTNITEVNFDALRDDTEIVIHTVSITLSAVFQDDYR